MAMQPALRITPAARAVVGRGMHLSTTARIGLKESSSRTFPFSHHRTRSFSIFPILTPAHTPAETNEDYDKHKKDSVDKAKSGKGHWKPELASDSEEAVKADRVEHSSVKDLQEKTKRHAEDKAKAGTSMNDGM